MKNLLWSLAALTLQGAETSFSIQVMNCIKASLRKRRNTTKKHLQAFHWSLAVRIFTIMYKNTDMYVNCDIFLFIFIILLNKTNSDE